MTKANTKASSKKAVSKSTTSKPAGKTASGGAKATNEEKKTLLFRSVCTMHVNGEEADKKIVAGEVGYANPRSEGFAKLLTMEPRKTI